LSPTERIRHTSPWRYVELLVLVSFAVSQPLYSLVGSNGTFLVAHDVEGGSLVRYTLTLLLGPTVVLIAVYVLAVLIHERVGRLTHVLLLGLLLGLVLGPPLNRAIGLSGFPSVLVLLVFIAAGIAMFAKVKVAAQVVRYASFAPALFVLLFLFRSPASVLLSPDDPDVVTSFAAAETPVVWLVLDQFPLAMMVDSNGQIIGQRFPGFSRLADTSTWYSNATTVSTDTAYAMASTLSGRYASIGDPPTASVFPTNVFTLLAGSHQIVALENVTRLCPDWLCGGGEPTDRGVSVWKDTLTVYARVALAADIADLFVPPISGRWGGFGDIEIGGEEVELHRTSGDDRERFQTFLDVLGSVEDPALYYLHQEKPHEPLLFLPDGRIYDFCSCYRTTPEGRWPSDPEMLSQRMQRYVMQAMSADRDLGRMLDRLQAIDLFDDAMIVVMSDHGASPLPGNFNRNYSDANRNDVLPVPMFIKLPQQTGGVVDTRATQLIDILPTVLDVQEIDGQRLELDGLSLLGEPSPADPTFLITNNGVDVVDPAPRVTESPMIEWIDSLLPEPADPFVFGPNGALVGTSVSELVDGTSDLTALVLTTDELAMVDLNSDYVPAHVIGELMGSDGPVAVAVALNGTIAGVGMTFDNDVWRISVMVDPQYIQAGRNEIALYEVTASGLLAIELG
jgi:hypothetical protein